MFQPGLSRGWRVLKAAVTSRDFWSLIVWALLAIGCMAWLLWLSVRDYDTYLRLKPLICDSELGNRQTLVIIVSAPLAFAFGLAALGELWTAREIRRFGHKPNYSYLWGYTLATVLGCILVYQALAC